MRLTVTASVLALAVAACASSLEAPATLEDWCATQAADRSVEAVVLLHHAPRQRVPTPAS
ncbi:MAG: hypothetical protein WD651_02650 [Acidimicrobiia bacterium]